MAGERSPPHGGSATAPARASSSNADRLIREDCDRKAANPRGKAAKIGAGEGIRTLDPDLGKVVLYP